MKILALERPGRRAQAAQPLPDSLLADEARAAWRLRQEDVLREAYFRADRREAVLVLECADAAAARAALSSLPLVHAGLIEFEIVPLVPYDGFARLFGNDTRGAGTA